MRLQKIMVAVAALAMAISVGIWAIENNIAMLLVSALLAMIPFVLLVEGIADKIAQLRSNN